MNLVDQPFFANAAVGTLQHPLASTNLEAPVGTLAGGCNVEHVWVVRRGVKKGGVRGKCIGGCQEQGCIPTTPYQAPGVACLSQLARGAN